MSFIGSSRRRSTIAALAALIGLVGTLAIGAPAVADEDDPLSPVVVDISKTVDKALITPGETVTYSIAVNCASTMADCVNLAIDDTIPAPLVLGSVALPTGGESSLATVATDPATNSFRVSFVDDLGEGRRGLQAGVLFNFAVTATLPTSVSADFDGQTITNTAFATLDNLNSNKDDSADVVLDIPLQLRSSVDKSYSESDVPSVPGRALSMSLSASNTSNIGVDRLVIEDATAAAFTHLRATGLSVPTWPTGADEVRVDWFDGTDWSEGAFGATAVIPDGVDPRGLRFVFQSSTGAPLPRDASAVVSVALELRDSVLSISGSASVSNVASSWVELGEESSTPVSKPASMTITKAEISPVATKSFSTNSLVGGREVTATLGASNGGRFDLESMAITEPATDTPDLIEQGLSFGGWVSDDIEWPVGATEASVAYRYEGQEDFAAAVSTTTRDTLPAPDAEAGRVAAFIVTFTGLMPQYQYAVVPYTATTSAVAADETHSNTIQVDVETTGGLTASTTASADLTSRTARINTTVRKIATPDSIYSVAGSSSIVVLPAALDARPTSPSDTGGSTVGADSLVVVDDDEAFFDLFNVTSILPTVVPSGVTLTVEYFDGEAWHSFDGVSPLAGPATFSRTLSGAERELVAGVRFTFTPSDGSTLAPGFAVQPNLRVALRSTLRSDPASPAANPDAPALVTVSNTATSIATSSSATPSEVSDDVVETIGLRPVPGGSGGSGGIQLVTKRWAEETLPARTGERSDVVVSWGTGNLEFESVAVSDPADPTTGVAGTVFEAFDLVAVKPITSSLDPYLTYDAVTAVELYIDGEWVPTATNPCASGACDGAFPGYTLTADERADAVGVRLVFEESPTRGDRIGSDPDAPPVGSGVASTFQLDRDIALTFELRDVRRSNPDVPVLGSSRLALYNAGPGDYGVVRNTARVVGTATDDSTRSSTWSDDILLLDQALTVVAGKTWTGGPLGMPPEGTPQSLFPTARMTLSAQNTSLARVEHLSLAEPSNRVTVNPFEFVTLTDLVSIQVPNGPTATVTLQPSGAELTIAEALLLTRSQLADVTGFEVSLDGVVPAGATITVVADTQLRSTERTSGDEIVDARQLDNDVAATIVDPGGSQLPAEGSDVNVVTSYASAHVDIQVFEYGVEATKTLIADTTASGPTPATQYESTTPATVRLTGQPTGNVRTTRMVLEDTDPSFWNAFDFVGFPALSYSTPINRVQVDALVGVEYTVAGDGSISWSCPETDCWVTGTPSATPTLPAGVDPSEVRGIRLTFTKSDYSAWERPFNPLQVIDLTVERRETLIAPAGEPVPTTLFTFTEPAPGETEVGVYTNDVTVDVAAALNAEDTDPVWQASDDDSSSILVQHLPARISIVKSQYGPQSLGVDIPFDITVTNTGGAHDSPLTGLTIVDEIHTDASGPRLVVPVDPDTNQIYTADEAFTYSLLNGSGAEQPAPDVTASYDDPEHPAVITFELEQPLPLGWSLVIHAPLQFRALLGAGLETDNTVTATADQPFDVCRGAEDTGWVPETYEVFTCEASTTVWPLPSSPMTIVKGVRGVEAGPLDEDGVPLVDPDTGLPFDDLGVLRTSGTSSCEEPTTAIPGRSELFYRFPCVPITRPGAEEEWGARFFNSGNISIKQLVAIDVLPAPNDRGVIIDEARSSKWAAKLSSYPEVTGMPDGSTYTVYYTDQAGVATPNCNGADIQLTMGMTTATNPPILNTAQYRNCLAADGASLLAPREWKVLDPGADAATLASVVALKFDVRMPSGLEPGNSVGVLYSTVTANQQAIKESTGNLFRDSIAYNSIAGAAVGINHDSEGNPLDLAYRFVTEPRKVGVALATGQLTLSKSITGDAAAYATDVFNLAVSCTSNDEPVALTLADGSPRSPFAVTAGSPLNVYGIPLYSDCTVGETGSYGATTVTTPGAPVPVLAQPNSGTSTVFDPHPAFEDRPAPEVATVTNDYPDAQLTITKSVTTNGAVDQDGTPIAYLAALVTASCSFDNGTGSRVIWSITNEPVTPSAPIVKTGLPAGAVCTVTESNQRGATTTSTVSTTGATDDATVAPFTLAEDGNTVAFANDFGVGSLTVTKALAGLAKDSDWAAGPFDIRVVCTNSNATSTTVFAKTFSVTRTSPSFTIDNLATGSSCAITEPQKNGATSTTLPSNVTITRSSSSATVTNTFDFARLTVSKTVTTNAVDGAGAATRPGPFDFSVTCTFTHAGTTDTVLATGFSASPMTFSLSHGQSRALTGLPAGSSCTVTEATPPGSPTTTIRTQTATVGATTTTGLSATISSLTPDSSPTTGTNTALVTNTYPVGTLRIVKSLQGGASTQFGTGPFTFLVTCTQPGMSSGYSKTVTQNTAGTTNVTNILAGSVCSVSESNFSSTGADALVYLNNSGTAFDGTGTTIVGSATRQVTVQNWYLTGQVTVTKQVEGPAASYGTGPFTVHLDCTRDGKTVTIAGGADRTLTNGSSTTYTLLPSGALCTLSEPGSFGAGEITITDSEGTFGPADDFDFVVDVDASSRTDNQVQPALTLTNHYEFASLTIEKHVVSDAEHEDGSLVEYGAFGFTVECTFEGAAVRATGFSVNAMAFTLEDGQSRTLTGLPAGAECAVTESDPRGAAVTTMATVDLDGSRSTDATTVDVVLAPDFGDETRNTVSVTNTYRSGILTLSKAFTGDARLTWGSGRTAVVDLECRLGGPTGQVVWEDTFEFTDGSPTYEMAPVAAGAECAVIESDTAGATATSILVGSTSTAGTSATATIPADSLLAVTVSNRYDFASLTVSKTVLSDAEDQDGEPVYPGGSFAVAVECSFLGETVLATGFDTSPMTFSLGHLGSQTLTGLPAGASCAVTETDTVEAASTSIATATSAVSASTDDTTATIASVTSDSAGAATNSAAITNRYGIGSLTVEKILEGGAAAQYGDGPFDIHVECVAAGGVTAFDDTVSLPIGNSWSTTIESIPVGSVCEIEETNAGDTGADAHRVVDAAGDPATSTTVGLEEPGYLAVENFYLTGSVEVSKTVTGAGAHYGDGPFEVSLECVRDGETAVLPGGATRSIVDGETVTYTGLPSGAECTLTESDVAGAASTSLRVGDAEVAADATEGYSFTVSVDAESLDDDQPQPAIEVVNDFPLAGLDVSKVVETEARSGDSAVAYGPFEVAVECTFLGEPVWATGYDAESPMVASLESGASPWQLRGLPTGAECLVEETQTMDADATVITVTQAGASDDTDGASVTIVLDANEDGAATNEAVITNSYESGSIELSKLVTGAGAEAWGTTDFEIEVVCSLTDASGTRPILGATYPFTASSEPVVIPNLPAGTLCTIEETATGAATATTITVGDEEPTPGTTAQVTVPAGQIAVAVENRFDVTSIAVDKQITGEGAEAWGQNDFEVTLVCSRDVDGDTEEIAIPGGATRDLVAPDYAASFDDLPVGADCAMTESRFGGANGSAVSPNVFTLDAEQTEVTVTNEFRLGDLRVTKEIEGDGVGIEDSDGEWGFGPFEVSLECERSVNGEVVAVEVPGGATRTLESPEYVATYSGLPAGAVCVVTESVDGDASSSSVDPGAIAIVADETVDVTVTNTFTIGQLQIVKTASTPIVEGAESFDYSFAVSNTGTVPAAGITVVDEIPALLRVTGIDASGWSECAVDGTDENGYGGTLTCVFDEPLAAGASATPFSITVEVLPEIAVDSILNAASVTSTTRGVTGDDDDETVLVKWLDATAASECVLDAPWFDYSIDARNLDTTGRTLTVTWRDGTGAVVETDEVPLDGGPIEGRLLWPGAEVNDDGIGVMWPGYRPARAGETPTWENLVLDPTLPTYGLRSGAEIELAINPETTVTVQYPEATPECAVEREPGLWVEKTASGAMIPAGGEFDYTISVGNDGLGAVTGLTLVDELPKETTLLAIETNTPDSADDPAWESCTHDKPLAGGAGGVVTCVLDRPLGWGQSVPDVVLTVRLGASVPAGSVTNVVHVEAVSAAAGEAELAAESSALILTPGMLALTGSSIAAFVLPTAVGLIVLGGVVLVARSRRRRTS
ncbi:DUF5979 domain-containing protein [Salinibacterium soli]|uniref:DUF5979 domain-containing protein n=1 Tax=Antiquaquibacter soli TaxID=3064523 RepID=A0ABT9BP63_9MICO|nr:DUF5979 domain-containing protein [Protaetiibacter sp. WY-16]MDO7882814.1 DUF5979 domain-containing protein [Protaetiibacter sp. WY-16]